MAFRSKKRQRQSDGGRGQSDGRVKEATDLREAYDAMLRIKRRASEERSELRRKLEAEQTRRKITLPRLRFMDGPGPEEK